MLYKYDEIYGCAVIRAGHGPLEVFATPRGDT